MQRREINADDRRTRFTRQAIRDALMTLLRTKPYSKISVTEICRVADINRGTFYIHYYDVEDVLEELLDNAFSNVGNAIDHVLCIHRDACTYPFCQCVQDNPEMRTLFLDDSLAEKIVQKVSAANKDAFISFLMKNSSLSYSQAEAIFHFQINGCMSINRQMLKSGRADWQAVQETVDRFIRAGLQELLHNADAEQTSSK